MPADKSNCICASACFLVYAAGVDRTGSYLALHRPYLPKETASRFSDVEREAAQRRVMAKVREYLQNMDVDQFFIDKMISNSSQDAYFVTGDDTSTYHLWTTVPFIEEIVLTECNIITSREMNILGSIGRKGVQATPEELYLKDQLNAKMLSGSKCKRQALDRLIWAAYDRELEYLRGNSRGPQGPAVGSPKENR